MAPELIGAILLHDLPGGAVAGRLVEVEAYDGEEDRASHARAGLTPRTATMYGPPGHAYVYLVYGIHHCLNAVTETDGRPGAVLVRAARPLAGAETMRARRAACGAAPPAGAEPRLAAGPGRLTCAFGIDRAHDGADLTGGPLRILAADTWPAEAPLRIAATPRVGVGYAGEPWASLPWRFVAAGDPGLSR